GAASGPRSGVRAFCPIPMYSASEGSGSHPRPSAQGGNDASGTRWGPRVCLSIVLGYVVTGKLGLMLAVPPGFASAIFPPAGIAVAAMLAGGSATLPCTFVGSFLLNVWVAYSVVHELDQLCIAAAVIIIATASTLQAAVGGWALRRAIGNPVAL